jgi:microsomal dipeptidase-like Zn-dependent dipeptidase
MKYFDFHAHTILKQVFSDNPNIDSTITGGEVNNLVNLCTDVPNIIESQIHQGQLAEFNEEVIIGVVLYGLESNLASEVIPLRDLLKTGSRHKLSQQLLQDIRDNKFKAFTDFAMAGTLDRYLGAPSSFNVLKKSSFNTSLPLNKVNVFFVVEGCHTLVDSANRYTGPGEKFPPDEILRNLDKLLAKVRVICINPTHLQQSNLCNQAFGIQLTAAEPFFPTECGLTDDGRKVIQGMFDRGICVDVKHMSYKSRMDLRDEIDGGAFTKVQPLLCTHAGFTGIPFKDWPGYISRKSPASAKALYIETAKTMQTKNQPVRPGAPAFNMTTINLFDEEIAWIVLNGGMIGLSMDRRIIGYVGKFDDRPTGIDPASTRVVDKEFFSKTEWTALGIKNNQVGQLINDSDCVQMDDLEESAEGPLPRRNEYFYDHVLLHIKHYLQTCHNYGIDLGIAQKQLTIGSDYDGLINPFINMPTVKEMKELKEYIRMNLGFYLHSLSDSAVWANQVDIDEFTEDLFYHNGYNFLKSRF